MHRLAMIPVAALAALPVSGLFPVGADPTAPVAAAAAPTPAVVEGDRVLVSFAGANGAGPLSGVTVGPGGVLYGTTVFGGSHGDGCVFSMVPSGAGYHEHVLFSFHGADGAKPAGGVVADAHGDLFGDTIIGGSADAGTVFELRPTGSGYKETVLYNFTGGLDGNQPIGAPVLDAAGDLFGVTQFGGSGGQGVVFEVEPSPTRATEHVLHNFDPTDGQPQAGITLSGASLYGTLYGASQTDEYGEVFRVGLSSSGLAYRTIFAFDGTDGANPFAVLTVNATSGVVYGTTEYGGGPRDSGTVFALTPAGGGYREEVLHGFTGNAQGALVEAPVLEAPNGALVGTADIGGTGCSNTGCGTIWELQPAAASGGFTILHRFAGPPDGATPEWSGLVVGDGGALFGTTRSGGMSRTCADGGAGGVLGCGTVYELPASAVADPAS